MKTLSARELKNKTGEALRAVKNGESVLITSHGKPVGVLMPVPEDGFSKDDLRPYEEAWSEIEQTLGKSKPHFKSWREAEDMARGRR